MLMRDLQIFLESDASHIKQTVIYCAKWLVYEILTEAIRFGPKAIINIIILFYINIYPVSVPLSHKIAN